jgi:hypothetical protein
MPQRAGCHVVNNGGVPYLVQDFIQVFCDLGKVVDADPLIIIGVHTGLFTELDLLDDPGHGF